MCDIPPSIPAQPSGQVNGLTGMSYIYNASTTDAEGDDTGEVCVGPFSSGTCASVTHTWTEEETYTVKAKATDIYGAESDWATLEVEMPVNQQVTNSLLQMILERFPNAFPILRQLLRL